MHTQVAIKAAFAEGEKNGHNKDIILHPLPPAGAEGAEVVGLALVRNPGLPRTRGVRGGPGRPAHARVLASAMQNVAARGYRLRVLDRARAAAPAAAAALLAVRKVERARARAPAVSTN